MNKKKLFLITMGILLCFVMKSQDSLVIQEGELGVCTMDGVIDSTSNAVLGSTGVGIANIDNGLGIGMSWSFQSTNAGKFRILCRYGLGGTDLTSRDGKLLVNNITVDTMRFPHTGLWTNFIYTDTIEIDVIAGLNKVLVSSVTDKGLPNIDYFMIMGTGFLPATCTPSYTFQIQSNDVLAGNITYNPVQDFYDAGDLITVTATANVGYFFHSWSGQESSAEASYTFAIQQNTQLTALFYTEGSNLAEGADCYATVQHDNGTPYLLTGGYLGETVEVDNLDDLSSYLNNPEPYVVILNTHVFGTLENEIKISSNKTLIGGINDAHIEGIKVSIENSRNVIIKNITFSKVLGGDLIEINTNSKNIWIDHCEFFTDRDHDDNEDYYDGMLDIKNESSFITVSWCYFHDHNKGILVASGDQATYDSIQRMTFHHNYFYNCNARLPSVRFGKAHIFNNFYESCNTAVNSRMNACLRVEKNYFKNVGDGVDMLYSALPGAVDMVDNIFENTAYTDSPKCVLNVPYEYMNILDDQASLPDLIKQSAGRFLSVNDYLIQTKLDLDIFPNPSFDKIYLHFWLPVADNVFFNFYDIVGNKIKMIPAKIGLAGKNYLDVSIEDLKPGLYICQMKVKENVVRKRFVKK